MKENKKLLLGYIMFCFGILFAFGFITLLKFQNPTTGLVGFLLCLVGMHAGIILFIFSKKFFNQAGLDVKKYYSEEYIYLLFYIPVLFYKFVICNIWKTVALPTESFTVLILTLTVVLVIFSIRNCVNFAKDIESKKLPVYVPKEKKVK